MSDTVVLDNSPVGGFRPGEVIAEKYRLEREIGRGAMGTVWKAVHVTLGQKVAIKLIAAEQAGSNDARLRFGLEAKAAARLKSRHVVQVYDSGHTQDGIPYIVMEYLEGQTLEERLAAQRDMSLGEAVRITTHVGRALARAHAQGIVHRDLKSGNIFIAKSDDDELGWVAKVLDFGVAKLTDVAAPSTTKTGAIVGTPLFMSPEQIRGASQVDHRADLYSLGMVFYNMVTGSHAFDGPSYSDVLVSICTEALPSIRNAAPWLPVEVADWFEKACAREREQRFQSADELVDALQQAAGPAGRLTRPSVNDEGPASTMLGHVPPTAGATIQIAASGGPSSARAPLVQRDPLTPQPPLEPERLAGGTLRSKSGASGERPILTPEVVSLPMKRMKAGLWVWAAGGVGLGVLTLLVVALASRLGAPDPEPAEPKIEQSPPAPQPIPPPPVVTNASPPPTPPPAAPETARAETPATDASPAAKKRKSSSPGTAVKTRAPAAAPPPAAAPRVETPAPRGAPDMGF
jgi:serine/threonine-protein kinase